MRRYLFLVLMVFFPAALAAQTMDITAEPPWVDVLATPADRPDLRAEAWDGVHYILSDHQLRWEGETKLSYARTLSEITDRAGLEELSTVREDFDPAFEAISLVRLIVIRDGVEIDLKDKVRFEVYRRETRLDEGIIDGTLTAVAQIPDLRVGDILDKATILTRRPVVPAVGLSGGSILEWGVPVGLTRAVAYWPEAKPLVIAPLPPSVVYTKGQAADGVIRHEWRREGHIPPPEEEAVPSEVYDYAALRFSEMSDWSALSAALTPYYAADYPLPPAWEAHVDRIARETEDPGARAIAALRLVQDEVRYVSLSVGAGGYFVRLPEEVIATGFGDCKDKSLLLRVLLSRLGVTAAVALTDLDDGYGLAEELPVLGVFDHMIVRITLGDRALWFDPTGSHQGGGIETMAQVDYGFALPLTGATQTALEPMPFTPEGSWHIAVEELFQFAQFGVVMTVKTVHTTGSADSARARWATNPASQISRDFLDYYHERYPGLIQMAPLVMTDDRAANRVEVTESYFLPLEALGRNGLREKFIFGPESMTGDIPERLDGPRRLPLLVAWPAVHEHTVEVRGAPIEFDPPEALSLLNAGFDFTYDGTARSGGNMTLRWKMVTKSRSVPADKAQGVVDDAGTVSDMTWLWWDMTAD